jgi:adenylate cyclase
MTRTVPSLLSWLAIAVVVASSGIAYSMLFSQNTQILVSAVFALFCGMPVLAFERGLFASDYRHWMRRLPAPAFIALALVTDFFIINVGFSAAGALLKSLGVLTEPWEQVTRLPLRIFVYAFVASGVIVFVLHVRELLGRDVFLSLLTGRYRNPVREERVFLFIDLVGSTAFAEEHGDLRAQQFLGSLFAAFAKQVRRHRGAIDDYVGDAAIITWPMKRGLRDAACIRCVFDIVDSIAANSAFWLKTYGQVPRVRAALHGGAIITAEIGVDHHKITYFGDTINTTARLETLSKTLGKDVLISSELIGRLVLPADIRAEDLGEHSVKGRDQPVGVLALERLQR